MCAHVQMFQMLPLETYSQSLGSVYFIKNVWIRRCVDALDMDVVCQITDDTSQGKPQKGKWLMTCMPLRNSQFLK